MSPPVPNDNLTVDVVYLVAVSMTPPTFYPIIYLHGVGNPSRDMIPPVGGVFSDFVPLVGSYVGGLVPFCASLSTISVIGISEPG